MKASELMIGNYVMAINNYEDVFFVNCVYGYRDLNISCGMYKTYDTSIKNIKPIPITEEWLLEFGFQKNSCYYISEETNIEFYLTNKKLYCELHGETIFNIENVHQLQNLYQALCGSELKIKQ